MVKKYLIMFLISMVPIVELEEQFHMQRYSEYRHCGH